MQQYTVKRSPHLYSTRWLDEFDVSFRGSHLHRNFQLVSITDIHSPTYRRKRCQNTDGPLNRKDGTLPPGAPAALHASNTVNSTISPSNHFANGRRMSQKLKAGLMNPPFFPFRLRQHCRLMLHRPSRTNRLHSSCPAG